MNAMPSQQMHVKQTKNYYNSTSKKQQHYPGTKSVNSAVAAFSNSLWKEIEDSDDDNHVQRKDNVRDSNRLTTSSKVATDNIYSNEEVKLEDLAGRSSCSPPHAGLRLNSSIEVHNTYNSPHADHRIQAII